MIIQENLNQREISEGPSDITPENVQFWCHHTQEFAKTQISKALKFLKYNCYDYLGDGLFSCGPIQGYNTRTYAIKKNKNTLEFECNCQKGRDGGQCAHILGLYYCFKTGYFKKPTAEVVNHIRRLEAEDERRNHNS